MLIRLYSRPNCLSCIEVKNWLEIHGLPYFEKDIDQDYLTKDEIKEILMLTESGIEEIVSYKSSVYKKLEDQIGKLSMDESLNLLIKEPKLIRRPIIIDDLRLQIGYNEEAIRVFLPRKIRSLWAAKVYNELSNINVFFYHFEIKNFL